VAGACTRNGRIIWPSASRPKCARQPRASVYHQGAIFGGLVGPVLAYFATDWHMGFAIPMLIGTTAAASSVFIVMLFSPETKGRELVSDIQLA
jgi:hypothetical protein